MLMLYYDRGLEALRLLFAAARPRVWELVFTSASCHFHLVLSLLLNMHTGRTLVPSLLKAVGSITEERVSCVFRRSLSLCMTSLAYLVSRDDLKRSADVYLQLSAPVQLQTYSCEIWGKKGAPSSFSSLSTLVARPPNFRLAPVFGAGNRHVPRGFIGQPLESLEDATPALPSPFATPSAFVSTAIFLRTPA